MAYMRNYYKKIVIYIFEEYSSQTFEHFKSLRVTHQDKAKTACRHSCERHVHLPFMPNSLLIELVFWFYFEGRVRSPTRFYFTLENDGAS